MPVTRQSDSVAALAEVPVVSGAVTGTLTGFTSSGEPLVDTSGDDGRRGLPARSCVALRRKDVGKKVVLAFEQGRSESPIILGLLQTQSDEAAEVEVDGKTIVLTGEETIVLRCGEASITLNRDGKVVIRGQHVVTHASGVNRIRGGSVQLN